MRDKDIGRYTPPPDQRSGQSQPEVGGISRRTLFKIGVGGATVFAVSGIGAYIDSGIGKKARTEAQAEVDGSGEYPQLTKEAVESAKPIGIQQVNNALKQHTAEEVCQAVQTLDQQNRREQAIDKRFYAKTGIFWRFRRYGEATGMTIGGGFGAGAAFMLALVSAFEDKTLQSPRLESEPPTQQ